MHGIYSFGQWKTSALNEPQPSLIKPHTHAHTHTRGSCFFFVNGTRATLSEWAVFTSINISTTRHIQAVSVYIVILHLICFFFLALLLSRFRTRIHSYSVFENRTSNPTVTACTATIRTMSDVLVAFEFWLLSSNMHYHHQHKHDTHSLTHTRTHMQSFAISFDIWLSCGTHLT